MSFNIYVNQTRNRKSTTQTDLVILVEFYIDTAGKWLKFVNEASVQYKGKLQLL